MYDSVSHGKRSRRSFNSDLGLARLNGTNAFDVGRTEPTLLVITEIELDRAVGVKLYHPSGTPSADATIGEITTRPYSVSHGKRRAGKRRENRQWSRGSIPDKLKSIALPIAFRWACVLQLDNRPQIDADRIVDVPSNSKVSVVFAER